MAKKMISPNMLYAEPERWLSVPHTLHESIDRLMVTLYNDWPAKRARVVCYACVGIHRIAAIEVGTGLEVWITGEVRTPEDGVANFWTVRRDAASE